MGVKSRENLGFLAREKRQLVLPVPHPVHVGTVPDFCPNLELAMDNLPSMTPFSKDSQYYP